MEANSAYLIGVCTTWEAVPSLLQAGSTVVELTQAQCIRDSIVLINDTIVENIFFWEKVEVTGLASMILLTLDSM
ncbi:MAG: hypothetical protein SFU98_13095 [Leptospiraceae bacterium]|nr:hypothetical protein [Leptospiraceae bacterium]